MLFCVSMFVPRNLGNAEVSWNQLQFHLIYFHRKLPHLWIVRVPKRTARKDNSLKLRYFRCPTQSAETCQCSITLQWVQRGSIFVDSHYLHKKDNEIAFQNIFWNSQNDFFPSFLNSSRCIFYKHFLGLQHLICFSLIHFNQNATTKYARLYFLLANFTLTSICKIFRTVDYRWLRCYKRVKTAEEIRFYVHFISYHTIFRVLR